MRIGIWNYLKDRIKNIYMKSLDKSINGIFRRRVKAYIESIGSFGDPDCKCFLCGEKNASLCDTENYGASTIRLCDIHMLESTKIDFNLLYRHDEFVKILNNLIDA